MGASAKYPIGIQSFAQVREGGYVYVDKTGLLWELANRGKYYFLSRPRRFGKSLTLSTLEAYFLGRRELFAGLEIEKLEQDWVSYPVLHLDLNTGQYSSADDLRDLLEDFVATAAATFGVADEAELPLALRFKKLVEGIAAREGRNVVILVDEYDKPLLNAIDNPRAYAEMQDLMKAFYGVLKTCDASIRFAMLTGVARFGKVSVFSDLNNLMDISLSARYNAVCGIAESELPRYFDADIRSLAEATGMTPDSARRLLRENYDGYRFADPAEAEGVYNPFSLMNCLFNRRFGDFWFETGTPTFLVKLMISQGVKIADLHDIDADESELMGVNTADNDPISLLYQTGYLTIRSYDPAADIYRLDFPNREVERGLKRFSFLIYGRENPSGFNIREFARDLNSGNAEGFMKRLQAMIAAVPYEQARNSEATYSNVLYLLFTLLGYQTRAEIHMHRGRADMVVATARYVYLFEFKLDAPPSVGQAQISDRDYAMPYQADGRTVVRIAATFSRSARNLSSWTIE